MIEPLNSPHHSIQRHANFVTAGEEEVRARTPHASDSVPEATDLIRSGPVRDFLKPEPLIMMILRIPFRLTTLARWASREMLCDGRKALP